MAKYLRYFSLDFGPRTIASEFPFSARFVFDLFELEFGKCPSRDIVKLHVQFVEDQARHLKPEELLNVLKVEFCLDRSAVREADDFNRKKLLLDGLFLAFQSHCKAYGWDIVRAEATYKRILEDGIVFDRAWGKAVRHPQTKLYVQAHAKYWDTITLTLQVLDARRQLRQSARVAVLPGTIGALTDACGSLEWLDETHVRLTRENKRDYWTYDLATNQVVFHFPRAEQGDPHGQYDVGRMYLEGHLVERNEELARHWFILSAVQGFGRAKSALERLNVSSA